MPLTEGDVLDTLSDPVALDIEFYADKIHVKGEYLTTVRDHIRAGNILAIMHLTIPTESAILFDHG